MVYNQHMKIGIYTNHNKDNNHLITSKLTKICENLGVDTVIYDDESGDREKFSRLISTSDVLVVLGGDGTILRVSKVASQVKLPILGINLGRLGFLTEVENGDLEVAIKALVDGNYTVEERGMLCVEFLDKKFLSLNEAMVGRSTHKIVNTELYINDKFFHSYHADGLIVSTPTGSTAYSLSAGGPVLSPSLDAMVVTTVCPHSLYNRPIVIPSTSSVLMRVAKGSPKSVLMVDGEYKTEMKEGDKVKIYSSELKARFIRIKEYNFFARLEEKLNTWSLRGEEEHD